MAEEWFIVDTDKGVVRFYICGECGSLVAITAKFRHIETHREK